MEIRVALLEYEKENVKAFLKLFDLEYDQDLDYTLYAVENDEIIGTISSSKYLVKAFAVKKNSQIASTLISELINYLYQNQIYYYQVYTKPIYKCVFEALNFKEIITSTNVCLLESRNRNIADELLKVKNNLPFESEDIGCIVMNCNPFTLGHQYLITEASKRHHHLLVFILEEDKSFFSFKDRIHLVREGTKHLKNVVIIPSGPYLISSLTFPTYFLKEDVDQVKEEALCDALIFKKYFIPIFKIKKRYLGTETDLVTNRYNLVLQEVLGDLIEVIPRIKASGENISASRVRALLKDKDFEAISSLVPSSTLEYLKARYE